MIGYKVFDQNFKYWNQQYAVGKEYKMDNGLDITVFGFTFCICPLWCDHYHTEESDKRRYSEIEVLGEVRTSSFTFITNHFKIIKELSREEFLAIATGWYYIERDHFIYDKFNKMIKYELLREKYLYNHGALVEMIDNDGNIVKYKNRMIHCDDGPAVIYYDGRKQWFQYGIEHRTDGPSMTFPDGSERWCFEGICHRIDSPAIINTLTGEKIWYIAGVKIAYQMLFGEKIYITPNPKKTHPNIKIE